MIFCVNIYSALIYRGKTKIIHYNPNLFLLQSYFFLLLNNFRLPINRKKDAPGDHEFIYEKRFFLIMNFMKCLLHAVR